MRADRPTRTKSAKLLGVAFDADDGHTRLTRGKDFVLAGGSEETHSFMQQTAANVSEQLDRRGKRLEEVSPEELRDIIQEAIE